MTTDSKAKVIDTEVNYVAMGLQVPVCSGRVEPGSMDRASKSESLDSSIHLVTDHVGRDTVVTWWKRRGLRKLYLLMPILMPCATVNGLLRQKNFNRTWNHYYAFVPGVTLSSFIGGRFLAGFGSNISIGAGPLLVMELAYPQHRGKLTTLYNILWGTEAMAILVEYHADGDTNDAFVKAEFAEIQETLRLERKLSNRGAGKAVLAMIFLFYGVAWPDRRLLLINPALQYSYEGSCSMSWNVLMEKKAADEHLEDAREGISEDLSLQRAASLSKNS
ncbi:hypothetical protein G7Y89_g9733 [Cudoniella acicularis]|uniref:Uncharacterized protein n=1 Tax=Cudoniella acicularis TaxID=354080 RepID=A0A8H4VZR0_9HELO|nr:hypothetical protein G7Y89_g9733 [Cudoniella acicularis]